MILTTKDHGNLSIDQDPQVLTIRQRAIVDEEWNYLEQVHGVEVVQVELPGECQGRSADALFTNKSEVPISIQVADCAPVALINPSGSLGLVHAGWKGLSLGVIDRAIEAMSKVRNKPSVAVLGPCIHPNVYEFGEKEMNRVCEIFGNSVRSETHEGNLALDLPKAVEIALIRNGVNEIVNLNECTSNPEKFWSHRLRKDEKRQSMVGWIKAKENYVG